MVEVANIHPRCVNIEAWDVSAASEGWLSAKELSEDDIVGNTEVELTVDQARELAAALLAAADAAAIESVP